MPEPIVDDSQATQSHKSVVLRAPAKLNLSLVVHGPQPNGFHQLETVMATIGLCDELTLSFSEQAGIHLHCHGRDCPGGEDNLIWRSANLLAQFGKIEPAVDIELQKRIPLGGGLGGGSSDAASCLMGLNQFWNLNLSRQELAKIAAKLGSDVPFFLYAPVAHCTGRGEIIEPLDARCTRTVLLILPKLSAPTANVFRHYRYDAEQSNLLAQQANRLIQTGDLDSLVQLGINNLARPCFEQFEPLRQIKEDVEGLGLKPVCLTGSGSTLFATFDHVDSANEWAEKIPQHIDVETLVTHF